MDRSTMDTGLFAFDTYNLGDDMQSLAVLAHVDRVHTFVDRDRMATFESAGDVVCVFNSWFLIGDDLRRPSPRIRPVWHGFCAGRPELLESDWRAYLLEHAPIGCRDLHTVEMLSNAGITATWTGCLTLFLGTALELAPAPERHGVLFVDVPAAATPYLPRDLVSRAIHVSTFPAPDIVTSPLDRFAAVARLLRRMAGAELVVTRRLHVALPAASVGTPVVAIPDPDISFARQRYSGFDSVIPTVYLDGLEALRRIDWTCVAPASIPGALHAAYQAFRAKVSPRTAAALDGREASALDEPMDVYRLRNVERAVRPARMRLRLRDRAFPLRMRHWCDRHVDVWLSGFPGLSKFELDVEVQHHEQSRWVPWGPLASLVISPVDLPSAPHGRARWPTHVRPHDLRAPTDAAVAAGSSAFSV